MRHTALVTHVPLPGNACGQLLMLVGCDLRMTIQEVDKT